MLKEFIAGHVSAKTFCTWGEAAKACGVERFLPTEINRITAAFRSALPGSDALIVNKYGLYGKEELVQQHTAFLQANGYEKVPGAMPSKVVAPKVQKVATDTAKEIAELKAMIATLAAQMAVAKAA